MITSCRGEGTGEGVSELSEKDENEDKNFQSVRELSQVDDHQLQGHLSSSGRKANTRKGSRPWAAAGM